MITNLNHQAISQNENVARGGLDMSQINLEIENRQHPQAIINDITNRSGSISDAALRNAHKYTFGVRAMVTAVIITIFVVGSFSAGLTFVILSNKPCQCNDNIQQNLYNSLNDCKTGWQKANASLSTCNMRQKSTSASLSYCNTEWAALLISFNVFYNNTQYSSNKAICGNYPSQAIIAALMLNNISCSGCTGSTCALCTDQNNVSKGYKCDGCIIANSTTGYCTSCLICTPVSTIATCRNYKNSPYNNRSAGIRSDTSYISLNQISCSECSGESCTSCIDDKNGNIGYSCSNCIIIDITSGYCSWCLFCSPFKGVILCNSYPYSITAFLFINTTYCSGCSGDGYCAACKDEYTGGIGYNCGYCNNLNTINSSRWYCDAYCSFCLPILVSAACQNYPASFSATITLNESSCSNCTGSNCASCTDKTNNSNAGTSCSGCNILNLSSLTGYCTACLICTSIYTTAWKAICSNQHSYIDSYALALNNTSCSGCLGAACSSCIDENNGNVAYKCGGCIPTTSSTSYCSVCGICTPVLAGSGLMALNATSCSGCSGSNCTSCTDKNNGIISYYCIYCTIVIDTTGYCGSCFTSPIIQNSMAYCENYFTLPFYWIVINATSCSGCQNTYCTLCSDANNNEFTGFDCFFCSIIDGTNIGSCKQCTYCTFISISAHCQISTAQLSSLNLNATSCNGCFGLICMICIDNSNNNIIGTTCSRCTITEGTKGYCSQCNVCRFLAITSITANCGGLGPSTLYLNDNSCSGCFGSIPYTQCKLCIDKNNMTMTGDNCFECTITNGNIGYCDYCESCNPISIKADCLSSYLQLNLNSTACTGCYFSNCALCTDTINSSRTGSNCFRCFSQLNGTVGYCQYCQTCSS